MRILSCNIRRYGADDGENRWEVRLPILTATIKSRRPDVIAFQEAWTRQDNDLKSAFPDYDSFGLMDAEDGHGPMNSVYYLRKNFARGDQGGFWLSETPDVIGSKFPGSRYPRLANWLTLRDVQSGATVLIANTHLDHQWDALRVLQTEVIVRRLKALAATPSAMVLTGDMNAEADSAVIQSLYADGWRDTYAETHAGDDKPGFTWHGFDGAKHPPDKNKIDWILVKGKATTRSAEIVRDAVDGRYPSDHYFVFADLAIG